MKRLLTPSTASAIGWWNSNPNAIKADCFAISLPTGQTLYATEGQFDLTIPASVSPTGSAITFNALQYGAWSRGKITSEAGFKCSANNMTLSLVPKIGATYPGLSVSLLFAAVNHLFDGAHVLVYTAWMPLGQYGTVEVVETKWQGWVLSSPEIGRLLCQFDCGDPFFLLNQKVPSRLLQSGCYKSFADSNCGLLAANYTVNFTATSGSTSYTLLPVSAFSQPAGYFSQGVVTCLTGANAGLSQTVKTHAGGALQLVMPWLMPVQGGDTFSVIKGCDQTPTTCAGMTRADGTLETGWQTRFGGMPFVPAPSSTI
jgi:Phage conserved hypothetical protein BR0599